MSNNFGPLDGLTAELWRELTIAAWPLKIVTTEEFRRMTEHLRCYDADAAQAERNV
jgi:hypothetical protein